MTANWIPSGLPRARPGVHLRGIIGEAIISPLLFTWMVLLLRWPISFIAAACGAAAQPIFWLCYIRDYPPSVSRPPQSKTEPKHTPWTKVFADRNLMLLTFAYGTLGYFQYIFFYWIYYYFGEVLHLGAQGSAKYTTLLFLTEGAIIPAAGLLSDRLTSRYGAQFGRRIVPMLGLALSAPHVRRHRRSRCRCRGLPACLSPSVWQPAVKGPFWASGGPEMAGGMWCSLQHSQHRSASRWVAAPILTPYIASHADGPGRCTGSLVTMSGFVAIYLAGCPSGQTVRRFSRGYRTGCQACSISCSPPSRQRLSRELGSLHFSAV